MNSFRMTKNARKRRVKECKKVQGKRMSKRAGEIEACLFDNKYTNKYTEKDLKK